MQMKEMSFQTYLHLILFSGSPYTKSQRGTKTTLDLIDFYCTDKKIIKIFGLSNPTTLNKLADCYLVETVLFPLICSLCGFAQKPALFFAFAELSVFSNSLWPKGKKHEYRDIKAQIKEPWVLSTSI